ncbi:MAG: transglutaminase-like domain-containing protein, partial [Marinobacter sp.]|uniref:transglutaminase-like domain-containing protein n=1 Tax=Marinobacter sp. TaxID=50741 RepID=UPI0032678EFF
DGLLLESAVAPDEEQLASTLDADITPAIEALAEELNHEPVAIYQWVRNNIELIPSYGSIQGSEYTLENRRGNAFDTASLLIALLRASEIPARYAMGTVEIPADQVMNWVGGVRAPGAAGNLLGQGGIPNTAMTRGGRVDSFRLEHVWVEAWVDFHPSRGADHRQGDSWIPMDASFKQYDYGDGMALDQEVAFDAQALADTIEQQSTINEEEGWVQGVPGGAIEDSLEDYRAELEAYIDSQAPDATVGEVLGSKGIKEVIHEQLAPSLPYQRITRQLTTPELSDSLRWKFKYQLHTDANGYKGTELFTIGGPTVGLAGRKLSVSFSPATQEDEDTLAGYLPQPDENGDLDPGELPETLPGYLINLKAEFAVDEDIVVNPDVEVTMGSGLISEMGYWQPGR